MVLYFYTARYLAAAQCIVIGPVCGFVCVFVGVCVFVCGSVTLEIACIDPHQTGFVGKGSDHLQLINFGRPAPAGRGCAAGRNFLAKPYYSQRAVFASL